VLLWAHCVAAAASAAAAAAADADALPSPLLCRKLMEDVVTLPDYTNQPRPDMTARNCLQSTIDGVAGAVNVSDAGVPELASANPMRFIELMRHSLLGKASEMVHQMLYFRVCVASLRGGG
jgi:hypothetical protein